MTSPEPIELLLDNIFATKEPQESATKMDFFIVQIEGSRAVRRQVAHYNLDAIISVGYRVNSNCRTQYRAP